MKNNIAASNIEHYKEIDLPHLLIYPILTGAFSIPHFGYTIILVRKTHRKVILDTGLVEKNTVRELQFT